MRRTHLLNGVSAVAAISWSFAASAQDTPSPSPSPTESAPLDASAPTGPEQRDTGIQEIVVTAQKRAESVQSVPIAISAFTASALRERAVTDIAQLSNISPNVTFDAGTPFSGSSSVLSAFIRGIGSNDFAFNIDPGVGVYLDGVYLARTVGANQDLPDVERIEVLKGPQGTLFGRNTIGGAVSIVTRDPGNEFRFTGSVTIGSYRLLNVNGSVDLPLADRLTSMLTFTIKNRRGYQKRIPFPGASQFQFDPYTAFNAADYDTSDREGGDNSWGLRGKVKFAGNGFDVRLTADYTNMDQSAIASSLLTATPIPGPFAGLAGNNIPGTALDVTTGGSGFLFAGLYNFCIGATAAEIAARNAANLCGVRGTAFSPTGNLPPLAGVNVDGNPGNNRLPFDNRFLTGDPDTSYATGNSFSKLENFGAALTIDVDLWSGATLKSISAYRELDWRAGTDNDGSPLNFLHHSFGMRQDQFSQELQLSGATGNDALAYVLGAYYFRESGNLRDHVTFAEGLLQIDGPNTLATRNYAFYGQLDYRPIDLLSFTAGGRYTDEHKTFEGFQSDLNGFNYKLFNCVPVSEACRAAIGFPNSGQPLRYYVAGTQTKDFTNFSPKLGVQVHPARDILLYVSWSKGYKTGGWTTRLSNPLPFAPDFGPEEATTWEGGFKTQFLDRHLQINGAIFSTDYEGIQLNFQQGISPTIQNAGTARIRGFELEVVGQTDAGFSVTGSVGFTDAQYVRLDAAAAVAANPFQAGVAVGDPLPKTPRWKANISPRYETMLGNGGRLIFLADYTHTSRIWNDTERTFLLARKPTDIVNLSVSYREPNGRWDLSVGGTNITDERYLTTGHAQIAGGGIYGTYSRPAEWYARLGLTF